MLISPAALGARYCRIAGNLRGSNVVTATYLILLLRHADAEQASAGRPDAERRLTAKGVSTVREVVSGMRALGLPVDAILTSPLQRARETAAIVAGGYDLNGQVKSTTALAPGAGAEAALVALEACQGASSIMLVGHQPDLGEIASTLLVGTPGLVALPFKKAALAGISVATLPPRVAGVLEFFLEPRHLQMVGRSP